MDSGSVGSLVCRASRHVIPIVTMLCTLSAMSVANDTRVIDPVAKKVLKILGDDEVDTALRGGGLLFALPNIPRPGMQITAAQLDEAYASNELSADKKYKGAALQISGPISSVSKDGGGSAFVAMTTGRMFRNIRAYLADDALDAAANYRPGQNLVLICRGAGKVFIEPAAVQCREQATFIAGQKAKLQSDLIAWLETGAKSSAMPTAEIRGETWLVFWLARKMSTTSLCIKSQKPSSEVCMAEIDRIGETLKKPNSKNLDELKADYAVSATLLELPPLKSLK
jgi:hypothetical protein